MQLKRAIYALAVAPIVLAIASYFFIEIMFPLYSAQPGYDQDPAYAYLFNGLLLTQGQPPFHIDHPGTPLQMLFAVVALIKGYYAITTQHSELSLVEIVISNPESYLSATAWVLVSLNCFALYFFGYRIWRATQNLLPALFCQTGIFAFTLLTPKVGYPAPESILIFISLSLVGLLAPYVFKTSLGVDSTTTCQAKVIGIVCSLGVATKITFFPMLGLLYLVKPKRKLLPIGLWFSISLSLLTLPVWPNASRWITWIKNLSTHSGAYGGGTAAFIDLSSILTRLHDLLIWYPALYATLVLLMLKILSASVMGTFSKQTSSCSRTATKDTAWVFILVCGLQSCLVLKHPGAHYMIPTLILPFVGMAWLATNINTSFVNKTGRLFWVRPISWLVMLALASSAVIPTVKGYFKMASQRHTTDIAVENVKQVLNEHPNAIVICGFRCSLPKFALAMGLEYAPGLISPVTLRYVSHFYEYNIFINKVVAHGEPLADADVINTMIAKGQEVLLVTPVLYPGLKRFQLEPLIDQPTQSLYRVLSVNR
jgi:hypothetical protein